MEKKTIGKFISALRKANGMTQKELGEKLYVSDKTVSRWECDECAPDLSLLAHLWARILLQILSNPLQSSIRYATINTNKPAKYADEKGENVMIVRREVIES